MCDENKEKEKKRLPVKIFFGGRKEFQKQPTKRVQTETNEELTRDSTLNKATNSLLTSEQ